MPSTDTLPICKPHLTTDMAAITLVALSKHIADLQRNAEAAKGLGLFCNATYFMEEAVMARACYIAISRAE